MYFSINKTVQRKIKEIVGRNGLLTAPEERVCYSYDATGQIYMPDAVALPETTAQVAALLRLANEYRFPVIPRGAGSGATGGALPVQGLRPRGDPCRTFTKHF